MNLLYSLYRECPVHWRLLLISLSSFFLFLILYTVTGNHIVGRITVGSLILTIGAGTIGVLFEAKEFAEARKEAIRSGKVRYRDW